MLDNRNYNIQKVENLKRKPGKIQFILNSSLEKSYQSRYSSHINSFKIQNPALQSHKEAEILNNNIEQCTINMYLYAIYTNIHYYTLYITLHTFK